MYVYWIILSFILPSICIKITYWWKQLPWGKNWNINIIAVCVLSGVRLFATSWTVACQAPLSMGFSKQEYWVDCHASSRGSSQPKDRTWVFCMPCGFFHHWATWEVQYNGLMLWVYSLKSMYTNNSCYIYLWSSSFKRSIKTRETYAWERRHLVLLERLGMQDEESVDAEKF